MRSPTGPEGKQGQGGSAVALKNSKKHTEVTKVTSTVTVLYSTRYHTKLAKTRFKEKFDLKLDVFI